jgi:2-phospho-L-lactate guanylyltransferase
MKTWAVVPVKTRAESKSRLAGVLSPPQRADLVAGMLDHTLDVLGGWPALAGVLLVSADPEIWEIGARHGVDVLREADVPGLNQSLERAREELLRRGAEALLAVPADLPLLTRESLEAVFRAAPPAPSVVIAPDRHHSGTNALLISPVTLIPFRFGQGSLGQHTHQAQQARAALVCVDSSALGFDVDRPEDLDRLASLGIAFTG